MLLWGKLQHAFAYWLLKLVAITNEPSSCSNFFPFLQDTNSKYSSSVAAPLSSLDKTSVRSRFSSFGGSTTTDTSDQYSKMWSATDYFSHNAEQSFPYHNHSNLPNHSKGLSNGHTLDLLKPSNTNGVASVPPHLPAHHHNLYKQFARINRNDNF